MVRIESTVYAYEEPGVTIETGTIDGLDVVTLRIRSLGTCGACIWLTAGQSQEVRAKLERAEEKAARLRQERREEDRWADAEANETAAQRRAALCPPRE
jgi:hypothetical protein